MTIRVPHYFLFTLFSYLIVFSSSSILSDFKYIPRVFGTPCVPCRHHTNWRIRSSSGICAPVRPLPASHRLADLFVFVVPFNYSIIFFSIFSQQSTILSRVPFNGSMYFISFKHNSNLPTMSHQVNKCKGNQPKHKNIQVSSNKKFRTSDVSRLMEQSDLRKISEHKRLTEEDQEIIALLVGIDTHWFKVPVRYPLSWVSIPRQSRSRKQKGYRYQLHGYRYTHNSQLLQISTHYENGRSNTRTTPNQHINM